MATSLTSAASSPRLFNASGNPQRALRRTWQGTRPTRSNASRGKAGRGDVLAALRLSPRALGSEQDSRFVTLPRQQRREQTIAFPSRRATARPDAPYGPVANGTHRRAAFSHPPDATPLRAAPTNRRALCFSAHFRCSTSRSRFCSSQVPHRAAGISGAAGMKPHPFRFRFGGKKHSSG